MSEKAWWGAEDQGKDVPEASVVRPKNNKASILGSLALVLALTGGLVAATFAKPNPYAEHPGSFQSIEYPASVEGVINECGAFFKYTPRAAHYGKFPEGFFKDAQGNNVTRQTQYHPMIVPAYGYMDNRPSPENDKIPHFFTNEAKNIPDKEQVLRMMWDGWTIIWYIPPIADRSNLTVEEFESTLTPRDVESIKAYAESHEKVIALPWMEQKLLPRKRNVAMSRWASTQSCGVFSPSMIDEFINRDKEISNPRPAEPPVAQLDEDGEVMKISIPQ